MKSKITLISLAAALLAAGAAHAQHTTTAPSQFTGSVPYVNFSPLFTVGETITGTSYQPVGILDGLGAYSLNATTVRVLANHELGNTVGASYTLANSTSLTGARVSYFDIDKTSRQIVGSGLAYDTIYDRSGTVVTNASQFELGSGLSRLCSATLVEANSFGAGRGLASRTFFTGEETTTGAGGSMWALDTSTNKLWAVPELGRMGWENATVLDTGRTDRVAILAADDTTGSPMYMYIGNKGSGTGDAFLVNNGLAEGKLFAWKSDTVGDVDTSNFSGTGTIRSGKWVELTNEGSGTGFTSGYANDSQLASQADTLGAFSFSRPEDLHVNPNDGTEVIFASTGSSSFDGGSDLFGTIYKFDTNFAFDGSGNLDTANTTSTFKIVYDGDDAGGGQFAQSNLGLRSPDNLVWADDGSVWIQEDRAISGGTAANQFGTDEASIWKLDPNTGIVTRIAKVDPTAVPAGQTNSAPSDVGNWESSGIIDVSSLFGEAAGTLFLADVQAHSLGGGTIASGNLVEGGQLSFMAVPEPSRATFLMLAVIGVVMRRRRQAWT